MSSLLFSGAALSNNPITQYIPNIVILGIEMRMRMRNAFLVSGLVQHQRLSRCTNILKHFEQCNPEKQGR